MQQLGNLDKWRPLEGDSDKGAFFPGGERTVRLEVSAGQPTRLYVEYNLPADPEAARAKVGDAHQAQPGARVEQFIALVEGRDRIEFTVSGDFTLFCEGGDIMYYTADGDVVVNVDIAPVIFTRIANRKARNPNLEMMEFRMRMNLEARMRQMEEDALLRLQDRVNRYAPQRNIRTPPEAVGRTPTVEGENAERVEPSGAGAAAPGKDGGKGGAAKAGKKSAAAAAADD